MRKIVLSLLLTVAVAACTNIDCPVQNTVLTNYSLMRADGTPDTLNTDTLWVWTPRSDGSDTLLINRLCGATATAFNLPISYTLPEDTICTLLMDTIGNYWPDTIYIKKDNNPHFESVDCQPAFFHTITEVRSTHHGIDSVTIQQRQVTYDTSQTHFYLYLKARR